MKDILEGEFISSWVNDITPLTSDWLVPFILLEVNIQIACLVLLLFVDGGVKSPYISYDLPKFVNKESWNLVSLFYFKVLSIYICE